MPKRTDLEISMTFRESNTGHAVFVTGISDASRFPGVRKGALIPYGDYRESRSAATKCKNVDAIKELDLMIGILTKLRSDMAKGVA